MIRFWRAHPLGVAVMLAASFRLAVFIFALVWPIAGEDGRVVSPRLLEQGVDMGYYTYSRQILFHGEHARAVERYLHFYGLSDNARPADEGTMIVSAPLFPTLLEVFAYDEANTLPIAVAYLAMGLLLAILWLRWMHAQGIGPMWLAVFALLPNPVWLSLGISTDLPFAFAVGLFFFAYERADRGGNLWLPTLFAILAALTRGNGPILLIFLLLDRLRVGSLRRRADWPPLLVASGVLGLAGLYYLPEFTAFAGLGELDHRFDIAYFGISTNVFTAGLFPALPGPLDRAISIALLGGAKVLYFVGLRPSYWDIPLAFLVARAAAGLVLLPGLLYAAVRGETRHKLLILLYLVPIALGTSLDRYNLAIFPLLFYYGVLAFYALAARLRLRTAAIG